MPSTRTTKKAPAKSSAKSTAAKTTTKKSAPAAAGRMSLAEAMRTLEKAGSAQTRKTYTRHGAQEPMFGVSFADMKKLVKRIGVDHQLGMALWETKNHDACLLAMKIADPALMKPADLDRWAKENRMRMCGGYLAMLVAEGPHGSAKANDWLSSSDANLRTAAWGVTGCLANIDEGLPDAWFEKRIAQIEKSIHTATNADREAMNRTLITIGGRNASLRKLATAAAKRIGQVEVDHGDTACKTPDAIPYIEKAWARATAGKFASPAAQERARESMRTRC